MKSLEEMDEHELRERQRELMAELAAIAARMRELGEEGGPNAHPEGEDAA